MSYNSCRFCVKNRKNPLSHHLYKVNEDTKKGKKTSFFAFFRPPSSLSNPFYDKIMKSYYLGGNTLLRLLKKKQSKKTSKNTEKWASIWLEELTNIRIFKTKDFLNFLNFFFKIICLKSAREMIILYITGVKQYIVLLVNCNIIYKIDI